MNHMQTPMGLPHTLMPDPDPSYNSMKAIIARVEAREIEALKAEQNPSLWGKFRLFWLESRREK